MDSSFYISNLGSRRNLQSSFSLQPNLPELVTEHGLQYHNHHFRKVWRYILMGPLQTMSRTPHTAAKRIPANIGEKSGGWRIKVIKRRLEMCQRQKGGHSAQATCIWSQPPQPAKTSFLSSQIPTVNAFAQFQKLQFLQHFHGTSNRQIYISHTFTYIIQFTHTFFFRHCLWCWPSILMEILQCRKAEFTTENFKPWFYWA